MAGDKTIAAFAFAENELAFDLLYCVAFVIMDKQWLERNATYMEFNVSITSAYAASIFFFSCQRLHASHPFVRFYSPC